MRYRILGTAGHIDHGKSSLVQALTGVDPDRLAEEKARGITIELGFADLDLGDERVLSLVDVPGHERFVRHMVAGATGIDAVALIIAADEGLKPQTHEHLEICRLLQIRHGIVVITKADLVDPELLEVVDLEIGEALGGSFLEHAPRVAVSSVSGQGLDTLREQLGHLFDRLPENHTTGVTRLPIDRSFVLKGFGTVVTGSLRGGAIREGDEVVILPGGTRTRVRGLQVHGSPVSEAAGGGRTALNLQGIETADAPRGATVTRPRLLELTRRVWAEVRFLPHAPDRLLRGGPVQWHQGTAETYARLRVREKAGDRYRVEIFLAEPQLLVPGDRFILRRPAPLNTVGGGVVLDTFPPRRKPRPEDFDALMSDDPAKRLVYLVRRAGGGGVELAKLQREVGVLPQQLEANLLEAGERIVQVGGTLFERVRWNSMMDEVCRVLAEYHRENPLHPGMSREPLRALLAGGPGDVWRLFLERGAEQGRWKLDGEVVSLPDHKVVLDEEAQSLIARLQERLLSAGLDPPSMEKLTEGFPEDVAAVLIDRLRREGHLKRLKDGRCVGWQALLPVVQKLRLHAEKSDTIDIAAFKDLASVSRKNAIPLLELLDELRWTRREGNLRRLHPDEFPDDSS